MEEVSETLQNNFHLKTQMLNLFNIQNHYTPRTGRVRETLSTLVAFKLFQPQTYHT